MSSLTELKRANRELKHRALGIQYRDPLGKDKLRDDQIYNLAVLGLTNEEIAKSLKLGNTWFTPERQSLVGSARAKLARSLRYWQLKHAAKGNATLLVFLGKQYLGQKEAISADITSTATHLVVTPDVAAQLQAQYVHTLSDVKAQRMLPSDSREFHVEQSPGVATAVTPTPAGPPPPARPAPRPQPKRPRVLGEF